MNTGFVSVVKDKHDEYGEILIVRARDKEILEELFPNYNILETPTADYKYRVFCGKADFAVLMLKRIMDIDYDNFKNSVEDRDLHHLYTQVWYEGFFYQK